jgi:hypothetical protein
MYTRADGTLQDMRTIRECSDVCQRNVNLMSPVIKWQSEGVLRLIDKSHHEHPQYTQYETQCGAA